MAVILTRTAVTLYDIETRTVWSRMSTRDGERDLRACHGLGDTLQEYDTTDRDGNPLRVVLQRDQNPLPGLNDIGGVYEFAL